jgi:hypothetical protein
MPRISRLYHFVIARRAGNGHNTRNEVLKVPKV